MTLSQTNLSVPLTSFVGRGVELAQVRSLLATHRLVTVTGPGGAGKTRLAIEAARAVCEGYPGGVWFVDLAEIVDDALVTQAVADATGAAESAGLTGSDAVINHLRGKRLLLILDNCEHVVAAAAALVSNLLQACADLTVLATSREPVGVDGEITWRIPALSLPGDEALANLDASDAVRLFIDRAVATRPTFALTNENAPAVAQICARLDGIPLAIELAAARVRVLSPQQIADGLDDRFRLLGAGPRTALPRQATLAASVDWSVDLLDDAERCLLARLSVFAGSFDLRGVEVVCGSEPLSRASVLDIVDALVQKSLVVADDSGLAIRYRLLETIRQYAKARLAPGEVDALRDAHARHYIEVAERLNTVPDDPGARLHKLDADYPDVRAALSHAVSAGDPDLALGLGVTCIRYWEERALLSEGQRWLDAVLAIDGGSLALRARATYGDAVVRGFSGDFTFGERAKAARDLAREAGDVATEALASSVMAFGATHMSTYREATELADSTLALLGQFDEPFASAHARLFLGTALPNVGRLLEARRVLEEALEIQRRTGVFNDYAPMVSLALPELFLADFDDAIAHATKGVELASAAGAPYWVAVGTIYVALALAFRGRPSEGLATLARAREITADHPDLIAGPQVLAWGALVAAIARDPAAEELAETARSMGRQFAVTRVETLGLVALAECRRSSGDPRGALELLESAKTSYGLRWLATARVHRALGRPADALVEAHRAIDVASSLSIVAFLPEALDVVAGALVDLEADDEAARLFAAAATSRDRRGMTPWPRSADERSADIATAQGRLGDEVFERAWAEGADLDLDAALAYARRGRGKRSRATVGWASLTPVEREVVDLVADGLTNDQVAEKLFVSRNTVRTHLRNVFAKLNVTSRTELAAATHRHSR